MPAGTSEAAGGEEADQPLNPGIIARFRAYDAAISTQIKGYFERHGRPITKDYIEGTIIGGCSGALLGALAVLTWYQIY